MNLVDAGILVVIVLCVLEGVHKGFLHALGGIAAFFFSWLLGVVLNPLVANSLNNSYDLLNTLSTYVEGADSLGNIENAKLLVNGLTESKLNSIIDHANFTTPFPQLIKLNVTSEAFREEGLRTLGEYTNHTLAIVILNIAAFLLVFVIARLVFGFILNGYDKTVGLPVLKHFDPLLGGGFGLVNGIFLLFALFILVPTFMAVQPVKFVQQYLDSSLLGSFFYQSNFILNSIRGVL